ncbi:MAG: flagellar biosynthetic protein FliR [Defluviitaleaceae bacterium]|nr:flagellar biosynthetic protein FliR [Defluviitaleaceae bacterium]
MEIPLIFLYAFNNIDVLLIIMVRLIGFFMMVPLFSGTTVPMLVRIMFIVPLAYIIFTSGVVNAVYYQDSIVGLTVLMIREFFVGFSMSFVVYIVFTLMYLAGQMIDHQMGFAMVSVLDPVAQIQVPITGNLLNIMTILLLIRSGGFNYFIAAIYRSFEFLPVGQAQILNNEFLAHYILTLFVQYFVLGVQLAMPIVGTVLLIDVSMGFLVKAAPQMNVFVVGIPIKMAVGMLILYAVIPAFAHVYEFIEARSLDALFNIMGGLAP